MSAKRDRFCKLLDYYGPVLSDRCRDVLEFYYADDLSLAEISENCGITRQGVHDAIRRGEAELLELEGKLHIAEKHAGILRVAEEIRDKANDDEMAKLAEKLLAALSMD